MYAKGLLQRMFGRQEQLGQLTRKMFRQMRLVIESRDERHTRYRAVERFRVAAQAHDASMLLLRERN